MNADTEEVIKYCPTCLDYQATQPNDKVMLHKILGRLWKSVGADIFTINNKLYLCIVDYNNEFPAMKEMEGSVQVA